MCVREGVLGIWMGLGEIKVGVGQWGRALGPFPLPNSLTLNPSPYPCATNRARQTRAQQNNHVRPVFWQGIREMVQNWFADNRNTTKIVKFHLKSRSNPCFARIGRPLSLENIK